MRRTTLTAFLLCSSALANSLNLGVGGSYNPELGEWVNFTPEMGLIGGLEFEGNLENRYGLTVGVGGGGFNLGARYYLDSAQQGAFVGTRLGTLALLNASVTAFAGYRQPLLGSFALEGEAGASLQTAFIPPDALNSNLWAPLLSAKIRLVWQF